MREVIFVIPVHRVAAIQHLNTGGIQGNELWCVHSSFSSLAAATAALLNSPAVGFLPHAERWNGMRPAHTCVHAAPEKVALASNRKFTWCTSPANLMGKFSWLLIYFCGCRVGFDLSMCFTLRRKNKRARSAWPAPPPGDSKYFVLLSFICLYSPMVRGLALAACRQLTRSAQKVGKGPPNFRTLSAAFCACTWPAARPEMNSLLGCSSSRSPAPIRHGKTISPAVCPFATHQLTQPTTSKRRKTKCSISKVPRRSKRALFFPLTFDVKLLTPLAFTSKKIARQLLSLKLEPNNQYNVVPLNTLREHYFFRIWLWMCPKICYFCKK